MRKIGGHQFTCALFLASLLIVQVSSAEKGEGQQPKQATKSEQKSNFKPEGLWPSLPSGAQGYGRLLANPDVQRELRMTEDEVDGVRTILARLNEEVVRISRDRMQAFNRVNQQKAAALAAGDKETAQAIDQQGRAVVKATMQGTRTLNGAFFEDLANVLSVAQIRRLKEIRRQCYGVRTLLTDSEVRAALMKNTKKGEPQITEVVELDRTRTRDSVKADLAKRKQQAEGGVAAKPPADVKVATVKETSEQMFAKLSPGQKATLVALMGRPFKLDLSHQPTGLTSTDSVANQMKKLAEMRDQGRLKPRN